MKNVWVWTKIIGGIGISLLFWSVFLFGVPGSGQQEKQCDQQTGCHYYQ